MKYRRDSPVLNNVHVRGIWRAGLGAIEEIGMIAALAQLYT